MNEYPNEERVAIAQNYFVIANKHPMYSRILNMKYAIASDEGISVEKKFILLRCMDLMLAVFDDNEIGIRNFMDEIVTRVTEYYLNNFK